MKNKTKKIISVVVAVLFAFSVIGAIIVSVIAPKNNSVTASADTGEIDTYSNSVNSDLASQLNENFPLRGSYYFNISGSSFRSVTFSASVNFMVRGLLCNFITVSSTDNVVRSISASAFIPSTGEWSNISLYRGSSWYNADSRLFCILGNTDLYSAEFITFITSNATPLPDSANYDFAYNDGYEEGYQDGKNRGYEDGHNAGYEEGYDVGFEDGLPQGYDNGYTDGEADGYNKGLSRGHIDKITDPVTSFLQPVHEFMNTKFFGDLTYATIFNIILFVAVATIFIKMFSGG